MISSEMKIKEDKHEKTQWAIKKTTDDIRKISMVNRKQEALKDLMKDMPNPSKFVVQKNQCQDELVRSIE